MTIVRNEVSTLLIALLASSLLPTTIRIEVSTQQEMAPEWTIENGNHFAKLAVSADGKSFAAATNNTTSLHVFQGNKLLWASSVGYIRNLRISANGERLVVGTKHNFYFFDYQNATPQAEYRIDAENPLVAISASGNITVVGTTQHTPDNRETTLCLFEKGKPTPTWNNTFPGILESLSLSDDGDYIVAATSQPGILYLLPREGATPLWTYSFGERSGAAITSNNGDYIVAVGGNLTGEKDTRIYRFLRRTPIPNYMKAISELPSIAGLSISANGSIFAISYTGSNNLILFNLALPPYGYGPGSVLDMSLPSRRVSMLMSTDGRHIIVGTVEGIFVYEYSNRQLTLTKQYTVNEPSIIDVASSANGQFIIAAATDQNSKRSTIYLFDNFKEPQNNLEGPLLKLFLPAIIVAVALATTIYLLGKKQERGTITQRHHLENHNLGQQARRR